jgi:broad specificity phosphatase PhoE
MDPRFRHIWQKLISHLSGDRPKSLYFMRHGRTALDPVHRSDGWLDFPLSDAGQVSLIPAEQALKLCPIRKIYAPTLKRTTQSAEIMQSGIISDPEIIPADPAKTWNLGALAGTPKKPNREIVQHYIDCPDETPEGGESMNDFRARFLPWFESRKAEVMNGEGPILVITSGSALREVSTQMYGVEDRLDLDEGGLFVMEPQGEEWTARVVLGSKDPDDEHLS